MEKKIKKGEFSLSHLPLIGTVLKSQRQKSSKILTRSVFCGFYTPAAAKLTFELYICSHRQGMIFVSVYFRTRYSVSLQGTAWLVIVRNVFIKIVRIKKNQGKDSLMAIE